MKAKIKIFVVLALATAMVTLASMTLIPTNAHAVADEGTSKINA